MTIIGLKQANRDSLAGGWKKDPGGAAIGEVASKPATNMDDPNPHRYFQSTDATIENSVWHRDLGRKRPLVCVDIERFNADDKSQVRVLADRHWVRRYGVTGTDVTTTETIAPNADYAFDMWLRMIRPEESTSTSRLYFAFLRKTGATGDREFFLSVDMSNGAEQGTVRMHNERLTSGNDTVDSTARIDDGLCHRVAIRLDGSEIVLIVDDEVTYGTNTQADPATTPELDIFLQHYDVFEFFEARYWHDAMSLDDLTGPEINGAILAGDEYNLKCCLNFTDGSGTTVTDAGPDGHDASIGASAWIDFNNPIADHDSGIVDRWGHWRQRRCVRFNGVDNYYRTAALLPQLRSMTVMGWVRVPSRTDTLKTILSFGTGAAPSLNDWEITTHNTLGLRFSVSRFTSTVNFDMGLDYLDDGWHWLHAVIDGIGDTASIWVDGTACGTNGTSVSAFTQTTLNRLTMAAGGIGGTRSRVSFVGDLVVMNQRTLPAEGRPFGRFAPELDDRIVAHYSLEDGSAVELVEVDNRGLWGTDADFLVAQSAGTPDWTEIIDAVTDLPTVEGHTAVYPPGDEDEEGRYSRPPNFVDLMHTPIPAQHVSVEVCNPNNADGAIQVGCLNIWEGQSMTHERDKRGTTRGEIPPDLSWSDSQVPSIGTGILGRSFRASFLWLSQEEAELVLHYVKRARMLSQGLFFSLALSTENRAFWPFRSVYGIPSSIGDLVDRQYAVLYSGFELEVDELASKLD